MSDQKNDAAQNQELSEIENLQMQLQAMTENAKRAMADMQNIKRRAEEEKREVIVMANAGLIKALLPTLDNFHRAIDHTPEQAQEWSQGIKMCIQQIEKVFKEVGLEEIDASGQDFDPDFHEALIQGPGKANKVVEVLEKGYKIGNRVLRHAKVKVGNGQTE